MLSGNSGKIAITILHAAPPGTDGKEDSAMGKYMIKLNSDRCISCHACEVHCKMKNKTPRGARLSRIVTVGPINKGGKPRLKNMYLPCLQCAKPACMEACPSEAIVKRDDGIVHIIEDLCIGCKACIDACPWRVPQWNEEAGVAMKCDYCMDRVDAGEDPACVSGCTSHALTFVRPNVESDRFRTAYCEKRLGKK